MTRRKGEVKIPIKNIGGASITLEAVIMIAHTNDTNDSYILEVANEKEKY